LRGEKLGRGEGLAFPAAPRGASEELNGFMQSSSCLLTPLGLIIHFRFISSSGTALGEADIM
jgi:hypothetical protein